MKNLDVILIFVAVRIASVFIVQTYFVPDEYWQSLEVAHKIVFNYGYMTWEWTHGIRSYIYPLIIAGVYKLLYLCGLDTALNLIYAPRILQALLSAYSDLQFYKWCGSQKWAIFTIVTSWFWFYTGSRTLINTFECSFSTIALSQFPWPGQKTEENVKFITLIGFLVFIRPTAAIIWMPLCLYHLTITQTSALKLVLQKYLPIGLLVLLVSVLIDSWVYGSLIVTPYEFLKLNVLEGVASWYGSQPWHWYISTGFPAILGVHLITFVLATLLILKNKESHPNELVLLGTIVFTITVYSFLPHKEFRFILPILPIVLYISSRFLSTWSRKANTMLVWAVAGLIFAANFAPAVYLSTMHQTGTIDVMSKLRDIATKNPEKSHFLFLMPCHSTPYYSHLHINVTARFLTCEPNFNKTKTHYIDEADRFYNDPSIWLRLNYPPNGTLPSHIITFDSLEPALSNILSRYVKTNIIHHTHTPLSRTGKYVFIHTRDDF